MRLDGILVIVSLVAGCSTPPPASRDAPTAPAAVFEPITLADAITGSVVDAERRPIAGATVTLFLSWTAAELRRFSGPDVLISGGMIRLEDKIAPVATAVTKADGRYAIHGLDDGEYTLRVIAPGYAFEEREVLVGVTHGL